MNKHDIKATLEQWWPRLSSWAEDLHSKAMRFGYPLQTVAHQHTARLAGVAGPEKVRVWIVPRIDLPSSPEFRNVAEAVGLSGDGMDGLTLGYGILIVKQRQHSAALLAHELRHVAQAEQFPSRDKFLVSYLEQLLTHGYEHMPYEVDARTFAANTTNQRPTMKVFLDDVRSTPDGWVRAYWPDEVIKHLETGRVTELSLDHDLGDDARGTGYDVILWVEQAVANKQIAPPIIHLHTANPVAR